MISFRSFLIEANPDIMYDKEFSSKLERKVFDLLKMLDPTGFNADTNEMTGPYKYLRWIVRTYLKLDPPARRRFASEDVHKIRQSLALYDKFKKKIEAPMNDIGKVDSLATLYSLVEPFEDAKTGGEEEREAKEGAEKLFEDDEWLILTPETQEAACYYGKGTRWCTAAEKNNYFDHYNDQGTIYIIINKETQEKWQFHFESAQFMDAEDSPIELKEFLDENPTLKDFFSDKIEKMATGSVQALQRLGCDEDDIVVRETRIFGKYVGNDILDQLFSPKVNDLWRYKGWFEDDIFDTIEYENGDQSDNFTDYVYRLDDYFDEDTIDILYNLYRRRGGDAERDDFEAQDVEDVLEDEIKPFCVWCQVRRDFVYIEGWKEAFVERFNKFNHIIELEYDGENLITRFDWDVLEESYFTECLTNNDLEQYVEEYFTKEQWDEVSNESYDRGDDPMEGSDAKMQEVLAEYADELSQPDNPDL